MRGPCAQKPAAAKKKQSQRLFPGSTMLVVRNIPCTETIDHLEKIWPADQFCWNYFYLPYCVSKSRSMGYAFINFADHQLAVEFAARWQKRALPGHSAHRLLSISASTVQSVGDSLKSIKWELLLQLVEVGMEPVVLLQGNRVDARFACFALSQARSLGLPEGLTNEPIKAAPDFAPSYPKALLTGLTSEPVAAADDTDDLTPGVPEGEVPWPLHLAVLSL
eukprot:CAMPEP_0171106258 /NCGR_PEP_ID=MMETSP0766_2-20121228/64391_1 /TAXON_ID=439317 /ORGANISM="Gambierdiscus australes, Strain CAWD 149" /LENGTH=220 /DNA_ID=CAMNT_0011567315 /DNA_START=62 /DNA_END=724 /DNA_ORIENTATION=-